MAGFYVSGSTVNSAPIKMVVPISEDMYVGQLVMWDMGATAGIAGLGGVVQIADVANEANEDDLPIAGVVSGVFSEERAYDGTYYGDKATYSTAQGTVADTGMSQVEIHRIIPNVTIIRGPIYDAAFGTALTELVVTTASSGGVLVTAANDAITDIADDCCIAYCRSGANRGHYRIGTTTTTTVTTVTVPFPYGIVVGDVFVVASVRLGKGGLDFPATANCIDGNNDMNAFYSVVYQKVNLKESGKEYAEFTFMAAACSSE